MGGTAYAAGTIKSGDVVNGTLQGKDIKNGTLQGRDVEPGALKGRHLDQSTLNTSVSRCHRARHRRGSGVAVRGWLRERQPARPRHLN